MANSPNQATVAPDGNATEPVAAVETPSRRDAEAAARQCSLVIPTVEDTGIIKRRMTAVRTKGVARRCQSLDGATHIGSDLR